MASVRPVVLAVKRCPRRVLTDDGVQKLLKELYEVMLGVSICGLGQVAPTRVGENFPVEL